MAKGRAIKMGLQAAARLINKGYPAAKKMMQANYAQRATKGVASARPKTIPAAKTQIVKTPRGNSVAVPGNAKARQKVKTAQGVLENHYRSQRPHGLPSSDGRGGVQPLHRELGKSAERIAERTGMSPEKAYTDRVAPAFRRGVKAQAGKPLGGESKRIQNPATDFSTQGKRGPRPDGTLKPDQNTKRRWDNHQSAKSAGIDPKTTPSIPYKSFNATAARRINERNHPLKIGKTGQPRVQQQEQQRQRDLQRQLNETQRWAQQRDAGRDRYGVTDRDRAIRKRAIGY